MCVTRHFSIPANREEDRRVSLMSRHRSLDMNWRSARADRLMSSGGIVSDYQGCCYRMMTPAIVFFVCAIIICIISISNAFNSAESPMQTSLRPLKMQQSLFPSTSKYHANKGGLSQRRRW